VTVTPSNDATGVSLYTRPTFTFDEPMQAICCFGMAEVGTNNGVSAIPSMDATNRTVTVTPYGGFKPNTTYRLTLVPNPKDAVGNLMEGTLELTFTYGSDFVMPTIVSTSPANNATGVTSDRPKLTFNFERPLIHTAGYATSFDLRTTAGELVSGGYYIFPVYASSLTYMAPPLLPNTSYVLTFTQSYAWGGNALPTEVVTLGFTTAQ